MKLTIFLFVTLAMLGCRRNDRELTNTVQSSKDYLRSENQFLEIFKLIDEAAKNDSGLRSPLDCATVTSDVSGTPFTLEIDFGTGTACTDGKLRSGQIYATFTNTLSTTGAVIQFTSSNYRVSDVEISMGGVLANLGPNTDGKPQFDLFCDSLKMTTLSNNERSSWTCQYRLIQTAGEATPTHSDDLYSLTGNAQGRSRKGNTYKSTITHAVVFNHTCRWAYIGKADVIPENLSKRYVDYGLSCDNTASCKVNFSVVEIEIE